MVTTSVLEAGIPLADLRVEELEPRLEFMMAQVPDGCAYVDGDSQCDYCYWDDNGIDIFQPCY